MLKFKKIYIDSSYKVSGTSSDFVIDLPETVQLEENTKCIIHEVSIPHSWFSIQPGFNVNLYFFQLDPNGVSCTPVLKPRAVSRKARADQRQPQLSHCIPETVRDASLYQMLLNLACDATPQNPDMYSRLGRLSQVAVLKSDNAVSNGTQLNR